MVFPQLPLEVMRYTWRFDPRLSTSWGFLLALQKILSHDQMVFPQLPLSSHSWKKPLHLHNVPHQQKYPVVLTSKTTYSILFHPEIFIKIFTIHTRNQIKIYQEIQTSFCFNLMSNSAKCSSELYWPDW